MNGTTPEDLEGLSLTELLDQLHAVAEPPPVSWMPQTAGWIVLAIILVAIFIVVTWRQWRRRMRDQYRREALAELDRIEAAASERLPLEVAALIRRTALACEGRKAVAAMVGDDWLRYLDRSQGGTMFSDGPGRILATAPYEPEIDEAGRHALVAAARSWIRTHHAGV